jgi:hypothetical protein
LDDEVDPEHLDFVLEQVEKSIESQWKQSEYLDTRVRYLLGLIGVSVTIGATLGLGKSISHVPTGIAIWAAGSGLVLALALLIAASWPRNFYRPPEPLGFSVNYLRVSPLLTKRMLLDTRAEAYDVNQRELDKNTIRYKLALGLVAIAGILGVLSLAMGTG